MSKLLGLPIDDPSITGYTAVIQVGAIAAVVLYFWGDIRRIVVAASLRAECLQQGLDRLLFGGCCGGRVLAS